MTLYPILEKVEGEEEKANTPTSPNNTSPTKMSISLELAEKMLIKFDGTKNKLYEFVDNCDKAYDLVKPELKSVLFAIIETKLTDNARAIVRNRTFADWNSLKNHLLDAYSEKRTVGQWQLELNSCKQGTGESVMSFSNKIESCYVKLINSLDETLSKEARSACVSLLKNEALSVFLTGLQSNLSILVKSQRPDSLEKAIACALNEEQEQKSKQEIFKYQNVNNNFARHCNICNKPGHATFSCRFNKQNSHFNPKTQNQNIRHFNGKKNNTNSLPLQNQFPNSSHFGEVQGKFCAYCKNKGHTIRECRKLEYKKKLSNNQITSPTSSSSSNFQNAAPLSTERRSANLVQVEYQ